MLSHPRKLSMAMEWGCQNNSIEMFIPKTAPTLPAPDFGGSQQPPALRVGARCHQCPRASPQGFLLGNGTFWQWERQKEMQAGEMSSAGISIWVPGNVGGRKEKEISVPSNPESSSQHIPRDEGWEQVLDSSKSHVDPLPPRMLHPTQSGFWTMP